jgi:hypothetical protein
LPSPKPLVGTESEPVAEAPDWVAVPVCDMVVLEREAFPRKGSWAPQGWSALWIVSQTCLREAVGMIM